jgi:hypothetical protein
MGDRNHSGGASRFGTLRSTCSEMGHMIAKKSFLNK